MAVTLIWKKAKAQIGSLELDATLSEQHQGDVDVTDHPVERGANISDHARSKPEVVTLEGLITNTPISGGFDPTRAAKAYAELLSLKDAGDLLTVVTSRRSYSDMVLTSLSTPVDARTGQALRFSATLKQVRVVSSQTVKVTVSQPKLKAKKDLGKKGTPETPEQTKRKSLLKSVKDSGVIQNNINKLNKFLGLM